MKKIYLKPEIRVVPLRHQMQLLVGSGGGKRAIKAVNSNLSGADAILLATEEEEEQEDIVAR